MIKSNETTEKVAILDCGGQYTKVIDRKVRELGVKSDIFPVTAGTDELAGYHALILSGGPASVYDADAPKYNKDIFTLGLPVLGICYGFHLTNLHFGGSVKPGIKNEYGQAEVDIDVSSPLFSGLSVREKVLMSHGDSVETLAPGFTVTAKTGDVIAAIYNSELKIAAVQFHPEVDLTVHGIEILDNFLRKICGFKETYALGDRVQTSVDMIRSKVGNANVMVLVSGGVDSMVTAALLLKALPADKIYAIHVDHGFMRKNESDITCENLKKLGFKNLVRVNAFDKFMNTKVEVSEGVVLGPLSEATDPEEKRKIIGSMFIEVTREAAEGFGLDFSKTYIAQGTLRPDLIESGNPDVSKLANKIKTHHNDVDIVRQARARGMIVETNWDWHKDEVRQVARMIGVEEEIASRQPFPGPGLAVRIICGGNINAASEENASRFAEFFESGGAGFTAQIAPISSVGVQGDMRSYKSLALLAGNGIKSTDFSRLLALTTEIPNKLNFINRVVYALNRDKIDKLTRFDMRLSEESTSVLREADAIVTSEIYNNLRDEGKPNKINQYFAVLLPFAEEGSGKKYSAVIRAVVTTDFMTARAAVPGEDIPLTVFERIVERIEKECPAVDIVMYDVTGKPPATVEWE
ncbi:putative GMP synthase [glutamine-hydrolyzing] [Clostridia bacterium]|nr:putative GMP synthase [glutamine-hydrolyzing] [Clostridia bacterium]